MHSEGRAALHLAAAHGHQETVRLLLLNQAYVNARTKGGLTPIHHAARHGHHEIVNMLVDSHAQDIMSLHKKTALHFAAEFGHVQVCRQLVDLGSSPSAKDENGQTPLHLAAASNKPEVVAYLLDLPNNLELFFATDWNGLNAAHVAAKFGSTEVVQQLLTLRPDLVVQSKIKGTDTTALHLAALNGHAAAVRVIIESGGDPTLENKDGMNALHLAAKGGHWDVVIELEKFVSLTISSLKTGLAALHIAAFYGQRLFMQEMLGLIPPNPEAKQPTVTNSLVRETGTEAGVTPLHLACRAGKVDIIRLLMTYAETDPDGVSHKTGTAPVHLAAKNGSIEVVTLLLGRVDLSVQDLKGRSALMFATMAGNAEFCRLLLNNQGDPNIQDQNGWTALHYAASAGHLEIIELLVAHGGQVGAKTVAGKVPLQLATSARRTEVLKYLLNQPYDSFHLAEDQTFLYDLMKCSKEARQRPLEIFISHSTSPVEIGLILGAFYNRMALLDREYEHDLHHAGMFCNSLAHDLLQIACRNFQSVTIFRSTARSGGSLAEFIVDGEHPQVVALPAFQRFLTSVWYGFEPWSTWTGFAFFVTCFLCPPLWLAFSIPFGCKYNHIPVVKFSCRVISHLYFMVLLILVFMVPFVRIYERRDLTPRIEEGLLIFWIIGRAADEILVHDIRPADRILRVLIVAICVIAFVLHLGAAFTTITINRDLLFVRNELLAVGLFWSCAQLLRYLTLHPSFGAVEVLLRDLGKDVMQFFGILIPFLFGCTLVISALYIETKPPSQQPTEPREVGLRNRTMTHVERSRMQYNMLIFHKEPVPEEGEEEWNVLQIARKLYLSLFDRIKQPEFPRPKNGPPLAFTLVDIFHMLYLLMAVIVILKILVATFTNTYKRIQSRSDFEWKYGRAKLILNTDHAFLTPAPFSVFLLPTFLRARYKTNFAEKVVPMDEAGLISQPGSVKSSVYGSSVGPASWRRSVLSLNRSAGSLQLRRRGHPGKTADVVNWKSVVDKFHQQYLLHRRPL